jgi:peptidoglycan hydrolase-like protein with peptidoglycan-binding domain
MSSYKQILSNSKRNIIDQPNIIKSKINYNYEKYYNTPKMILVIENKQISKEVLNTLALNDDNISFNIDYDELNPAVSTNIFNFFNQWHSNLITSIDEETGSKYDNAFYTNNYNFAYHYFIDKKGNIYEGRPHNIRAFNLDIYKYDREIESVESNRIYDDSGKRFLPLLNQGNLLFNDCLVILTEEQTDSIDTTNATYTALKTLLVYLRQNYGYDKFFGYSELKGVPFSQEDYENKDIYKYNNPGVFFKINELHSAVENTQLVSYNKVNGSTITTYTYGKRSLKYNKPKQMEGNDVIMCQKMLYKLGLLPKYKSITGSYNLETKNAIKEFQQKYYITPENDYGMADVNTLNILRSKIYDKKMENIKLIDDNYSPFRVLEYIEDNNMTGYDVLILQTKLKKIIYPILEVNGIFDEYTRDAVLLFQAKYSTYVDGEMIDGKVGPATWKLIIENTDTIFVSNSDSYIEGAITPTKCTVSKANITYLQQALNKMLKTYGVEIPVTGGYDELTQKYIKMINENESNRKIIGLDKYTYIDENGETQYLDWTNDAVLKTCYPAEFIWLIKHYLLNEDIDLDLVREN